MEDTKELKSQFDQLLDERRAEGWGYVGLDQLRETRFVNGNFVEEQVRTEEEIRNTHLEKLKSSGQDFDIELVPKPTQTFQGETIPDKFGTYYVFARAKK